MEEETILSTASTSYVPEEYQVEKIKNHLEYHEAFELRTHLNFNPDCKWKEQHSKYVYLVKWEGYDEKDNTWEPEENLLGTHELIKYKRRKGLPQEWETFKEFFDWSLPSTRSSENAYNRRLNKKTSALVRIIPLSSCKKTNHGKSVGSLKKYSKKITSKDSSSISPPYEKSDSECEYLPSSRPARRESAPSRSSLSMIPVYKIEKQLAKRERKNDKELKLKSSFTGNVLDHDTETSAKKILNQTKDKSDHSMYTIDVLRYAVGEGSRRSRSAACELYFKRRCTSAERLNSRWIRAVEDEAKAERLQIFSARMDRIVRCCAYRNPLNVSRSRKMLVFMRRKIKEDGLSEWRVVGSRLIKKFLKQHHPLKMPLFSSIKTLSNTEANEIYKENKNNTCFYSLQLLRERADPTSIEDAEKLVIYLNRVLFESVEVDLMLRIAFTYSEISYKQCCRELLTIDNEKKRFDVIKGLISTIRIPASMNEQRKKMFEQDSLNLTQILVEADSSIKSTYKPLSQCSKSHWKCRMLFHLITISPPSTRFLDERSPFSTFNFLHCMTNGAQCQKMVFIKTGVPYGIELVKLGDMYVDQSHVAGIQHNIRYFMDFLRNGFDVNAIAIKDVNMVGSECTVRQFIHQIMLTAKRFGGVPLDEEILTQGTHLTDKAYQYLKDVCELIDAFNKQLDRFVKNQVDVKLKSDPLSYLSFECCITPVHTIRIIPYPLNNMYSPLTILFWNMTETAVMALRENVANDKASVVLCVYSVDFSGGRAYRSEYSNLSQVPFLRVHERIVPGSDVKKAYLSYTDKDILLELILDQSVSTNSCWYFVVNKKSIGNLRSGRAVISINITAPPETILVMQLVAISRNV